MQVSHGKAAAGDCGQCRAVQGGRHQEIQGHPQPEHPTAERRLAAPGRPLPHQGLHVVVNQEHGDPALPAGAAHRARPDDAVVRRRAGGQHRRLPGPGLHPLLPALAAHGHRHHRQDGLRHRVRPVQEGRRRRRRRGRRRRQGVFEGVQEVHGVHQDGPVQLVVHHPRALPAVRPDAVQAAAAAGARHGGLQDGRERAPAVPPPRCHHRRPAEGQGPLRARRRHLLRRGAGLHRGAAGREGERRRARARRQGVRAGGQARPGAGVRAPDRRDEDDSVHGVVGGVPCVVPPTRGGEAAPGGGRVRPGRRPRAGRRRAPEQVPLPRPGGQGGHEVSPRLAAHRQGDLRASRDRWLPPPKGHVRVAGAGGPGPRRAAVPGAGGVPAGAVLGGGGGGARAAPVRAHPLRHRAEGVHRAQVRAAAGEARRRPPLPPLRVPPLAGHGVAHPVRLRPRPRLPPRRQAQGRQEARLSADREWASTLVDHLCHSGQGV